MEAARQLSNAQFTVLDMKHKLTPPATRSVFLGSLGGPLIAAMA
jgi:hypothetical protein